MILPTPSRKQQSGVFLIEALVSVLIFMVGIIALVGIASQGINQTSQAKYRNDASYLAGELIADMWVTAGQPGNFIGTAAYQAWLARVAATLPGADANPPVVCVASGPCDLPTSPAQTVNITAPQVLIFIRWNDKLQQTDSQGNATIHYYQTIAQIGK